MYEGNHTCKRAALWSRLDLDLRDHCPGLTAFDSSDIVNIVMLRLDVHPKPAQMDELALDAFKELIQRQCRTAIEECSLSEKTNVEAVFPIVWKAITEYQVGAK